MNEIDSLRQEAETLKNAIRVSVLLFLIFCFKSVYDAHDTSVLLMFWFKLVIGVKWRLIKAYFWYLQT